MVSDICLDFGDKVVILGVAMGVAGVLIFGLRFIPGTAYLEITSGGFTANWYGRTQFYAWNDVSDIAPYQNGIGGVLSMVRFNYEGVL